MIKRILRVNKLEEYINNWTKEVSKPINEFTGQEQRDLALSLIEQIRNHYEK